MARLTRDIGSELKVLKDRAKALKVKKAAQLGDLVTVAGASGLDPEILAGALLSISHQADPQVLEGWRRQGREFFQGSRRAGKTVRPSGDGSGHAKSAADDRAR
jgi:hypothetical protein